MKKTPGMLVDGRKIRDEILGEIKKLESSSVPKKIIFISFGITASGKSFLEIKKRTAELLGIEVEVLEARAESTERAVEVLTQEAKKGYDGIVIQLPLSRNLDTEKVLEAIPPELDVDVLGSRAKEAYVSGVSQRVPPVARAVEEILKHYQVNLSDKKVVVLGKGRLVGEPVSLLMSKLGVDFKSYDSSNSEVEICEALLRADVVVSGIGVPHFIKPEMIKEGVVIIDAGTSEDKGKLVGDADPACIEKASLFTPIPGGVGPVTLACLFYNLYLR